MDRRETHQFGSVERAAVAHKVFAQDTAEAFLFEFGDLLGLEELALICEAGERVCENVGKATGHAGAEIRASGTEDDNDTGRHVFAAVLPDALDDGKRAAIANREALSRAASDVEFTARGAVQNSVACEYVAAPRSGRTAW